MPSDQCTEPPMHPTNCTKPRNPKTWESENQAPKRDSTSFAEYLTPEEDAELH